MWSRYLLLILCCFSCYVHAKVDSDEDGRKEAILEKWDKGESDEDDHKEATFEKWRPGGKGGSSWESERIPAEFERWTPDKRASYGEWESGRRTADFERWSPSRRKKEFERWQAAKKHPDYAEWTAKKKKAYDTWAASRKTSELEAMSPEERKAAFETWQAHKKPADYEKWNAKRKAAYDKWSAAQSPADLDAWSPSDKKEKFVEWYTGGKKPVVKGSNESPEEDDSKKPAGFKKWSPAKKDEYEAWRGRDNKPADFDEWSPEDKKAEFEKWQAAKKHPKYEEWPARKKKAYDEWAAGKKPADLKELSPAKKEANFNAWYKHKKPAGYEEWSPAKQKAYDKWSATKSPKDIENMSPKEKEKEFEEGFANKGSGGGGSGSGGSGSGSGSGSGAKNPAGFEKWSPKKQREYGTWAAAKKPSELEKLSPEQKKAEFEKWRDAKHHPDYNNWQPKTQKCYDKWAAPKKPADLEGMSPDEKKENFDVWRRTRPAGSNDDQSPEDSNSGKRPADYATWKPEKKNQYKDFESGNRPADFQKWKPEDKEKEFDKWQKAKDHPDYKNWDNKKKKDYDTWAAGKKPADLEKWSPAEKEKQFKRWKDHKKPADYEVWTPNKKDAYKKWCASQNPDDLDKKSPEQKEKEFKKWAATRPGSNRGSDESGASDDGKPSATKPTGYDDWDNKKKREYKVWAGGKKPTDLAKMSPKDKKAEFEKWRDAKHHPDYNTWPPKTCQLYDRWAAPKKPSELEGMSPDEKLAHFNKWRGKKGPSKDSGSTDVSGGSDDDKDGKKPAEYKKWSPDKQRKYDQWEKTKGKDSLEKKSPEQKRDEFEKWVKATAKPPSFSKWTPDKQAAYKEWEASKSPKSMEKKSVDQKEDEFYDWFTKKKPATTPKPKPDDDGDKDPSKGWKECKKANADVSDGKPDKYAKGCVWVLEKLVDKRIVKKGDAGRILGTFGIDGGSKIPSNDAQPLDRKSAGNVDLEGDAEAEAKFIDWLSAYVQKNPTPTGSHHKLPLLKALIELGIENEVISKKDVDGFPDQFQFNIQVGIKTYWVQVPPPPPKVVYEDGTKDESQVTIVQALDSDPAPFVNRLVKILNSKAILDSEAAISILVTFDIPGIGPLSKTEGISALTKQSVKSIKVRGDEDAKDKFINNLGSIIGQSEFGNNLVKFLMELVLDNTLMELDEVGNMAQSYSYSCEITLTRFKTRKERVEFEDKK